MAIEDRHHGSAQMDPTRGVAAGGLPSRTCPNQAMVVIRTHRYIQWGLFHQDAVDILEVGVEFSPCDWLGSD